MEKLFGNNDLAVIIQAFAAYGSPLLGFIQALARDMSQTSSLIAFSDIVAAIFVHLNADLDVTIQTKYFSYNP
jgi:hypothetical protein